MSTQDSLQLILKNQSVFLTAIKELNELHLFEIILFALPFHFGLKFYEIYQRSKK